jgi:hypothetical protein
VKRGQKDSDRRTGAETGDRGQRDKGQEDRGRESEVGPERQGTGGQEQRQ